MFTKAKSGPLRRLCEASDPMRPYFAVAAMGTRERPRSPAVGPPRPATDPDGRRSEQIEDALSVHADVMEQWRVRQREILPEPDGGLPNAAGGAVEDSE